MNHSECRFNEIPNRGSRFIDRRGNEETVQFKEQNEINPILCLFNPFLNFPASELHVGILSVLDCRLSVGTCLKIKHKL